MEMEIKKIRNSINVIDIEGKEEMIADEKKQENNELDSEEFIKFEEEMKAWRVEFHERIKNYKWQIDYKYDGRKGKYRGRGVNGKPDGIGVF